MKKLRKFGFLIIACALGSCNNYEEPAMPEKSMEHEISAVQVVDGIILNYSPGVSQGGNVALSFPDEESFEQFKQELSEKTHENKLLTIHKYGVENLYDLAEKADEELEEFGSKAVSEDDFRMQYQKYVLKYKGLLVNNHADDTDLTLYVPDKDNIESYIANEKGIYVVAKEIRVLDVPTESTTDKSSPCFKGSIPNADETYTNTYDVYPMDNKRIHFTIAKKYSTVRFTMYAKKKMWYGWKDDNHRDFIIEPHLSGTATIKWLSPFYTRFWSNKKVECDMFDITNNGALRGEIYTWTDLTAEHDADGNLIIERIGNCDAPRCLDSKSHIVKVIL